jgi:hypothetical protein
VSDTDKQRRFKDSGNVSAIPELPKKHNKHSKIEINNKLIYTYFFLFKKIKKIPAENRIIKNVLDPENIERKNQNKESKTK